MAKKSSKKKLIFLASIFFGVIALVMFVFPMLKSHIDGLLGTYNETYYTGFNMIFDLENCKNVSYSSIGTVEVFVSTKFVIVPLISAICTLAGIVIVLIGQASGKKSKALFNVVSCLCFVAAAALALFLVKPSFISANEISDSLKDIYSAAYGAYLVSGFNVCAGIVALLA